MAERVKRSMGTSNWARIPTELLELILSKMSTPTRICVSSVCFPWRRIAKNYFRSPLVSQVPVLMLQEQRKNKKIDCIRLYSLQDRRIYNFPNVLNDLSGSHCVGSSHGWLILQDEMAKPYLLNIFSETHIQLPLPPNEPVVDTESISDIQFDSANPYSWAHDYFRNWILIEKAILSANPSHSDNYAVMIIYGRQSRLSFFNNRDSEWTDLRGNIKIYQDIYCSDDNILYTLGYIKGSIEVWDFKNSPVPIKTVSITQSDFLHAMSGPSIASFSDSHGYLVKSSGEVLLVIRDQTSLFYHVKPRVKPGQSYAFEVYRLDFENETWSQVECLNDCVLFLGEKQHSVSVPASEFPGYKGNLICFSDDSCNVVVNYEYLDREDYEYDREDYNGEDRPVQVFHDDDGSQPYWNREDYNWEDRSVQLFHDDDGSQVLKFKCPPLWVVPT